MDGNHSMPPPTSSGMDSARQKHARVRLFSQQSPAMQPKHLSREHTGSGLSMSSGRSSNELPSNAYMSMQHQPSISSGIVRSTFNSPHVIRSSALNSLQSNNYQSQHSSQQSTPSKLKSTPNGFARSLLDSYGSNNSANHSKRASFEQPPTPHRVPAVQTPTALGISTHPSLLMMSDASPPGSVLHSPKIRSNNPHIMQHAAQSHMSPIQTAVTPTDLQQRFSTPRPVIPDFQAFDRQNSIVAKARTSVKKTRKPSHQGLSLLMGINQAIPTPTQHRAAHISDASWSAAPVNEPIGTVMSIAPVTYSAMPTPTKPTCPATPMKTPASRGTTLSYTSIHNTAPAGTSSVYHLPTSSAVHSRRPSMTPAVQHSRRQSISAPQYAATPLLSPTESLHNLSMNMTSLTATLPTITPGTSPRSTRRRTAVRPTTARKTPTQSVATTPARTPSTRKMQSQTPHNAPTVDTDLQQLLQVQAIPSTLSRFQQQLQSNPPTPTAQQHILPPAPMFSTSPHRPPSTQLDVQTSTSIIACTSPTRKLLFNENNADESLNASNVSTLDTSQVAVDFFDTHYHSLGEIGRGSFGVVVAAQNRTDGQIYAVKRSIQPFRNMKHREECLKEVYNYSLLSEPNHATSSTPQSTHPTVQTLVSPARQTRSMTAALATNPSNDHEQTLQHHFETLGPETCVKYLIAFQERNHLYIVTELYPHGTLRSFLDQLDDPIREHTIWEVACDLLLALRHIHSRRLVHLDLKPDNTFISDVCGGTLRVGDFGLTTRAVDVSEEGDSTYIAPELLDRNLGATTEAADMFALGLILYELAAHVNLPTRGAAWHDLRNERIDLVGDSFLEHMTSPLPSPTVTSSSINPLQAPTPKHSTAEQRQHFSPSNAASSRSGT